MERNDVARPGAPGTAAPSSRRGVKRWQKVVSFVMSLVLVMQSTPTAMTAALADELNRQSVAPAVSIEVGGDAQDESPVDAVSLPGIAGESDPVVTQPDAGGDAGLVETGDDATAGSEEGSGDAGDVSDAMEVSGNGDSPDGILSDGVGGNGPSNPSEGAESGDSAVPPAGGADDEGTSGTDSTEGTDGADGQPVRTVPIDWALYEDETNLSVEPLTWEPNADLHVNANLVVSIDGAAVASADGATEIVLPQAGDTFSVALPIDIASVADTVEPVAVYQTVDRDDQGRAIAGPQIATYTVTAGVLVIALGDLTVLGENPTVIMDLSVPLTLNEGVLVPGATQSYAWFLRNRMVGTDMVRHEVQIELPALESVLPVVEEPVEGEDPAVSDDTEPGDGKENGGEPDVTDPEGEQGAAPGDEPEGTEPGTDDGSGIKPGDGTETGTGEENDGTETGDGENDGVETGDGEPAIPGDGDDELGGTEPGDNEPGAPEPGDEPAVSDDGTAFVGAIDGVVFSSAPERVGAPVMYASEQQTTVERVADGYTIQPELTILFSDNNNTTRPALDEVASNMGLFFTLTQLDAEGNPVIGEDGNPVVAEYPLNEENALTYLGLSSYNGSLKADRPSVGRYTFTSAAMLPSTVTETVTTTVDGEPSVQTTTWAVDWRIADTRSDESTAAWWYNQSYRYVADTDWTIGGSDPTLYHAVLLDDFSFTVKLYDGADDTTAAEFLKLNADRFTLHATWIGDDGQRVIETYSLYGVFGSPLGDQTLQVVGGDESGLSALIAGKMRIYTASNHPISYYLTYTDPNAPNNVWIGSDFFAVEYDNSGAPNHINDLTATYSGGIIKLVLTGETNYVGTKAWADDGNVLVTDENGQLVEVVNNPETVANRPAATFTLMRYSDQGQWNNAAPVMMEQPIYDADGELIGTQLVYATATLPAGSNTLQTSFNFNDLPKYDPEGYPYKYCLREEGSIGGGYTTVFGAWSEEDGCYVDVGPYGVSLNGRPDGNPFIYNNGTITNVRTGSIDKPLTKTWIADEFQNSLGDVTCTFELQRKMASEGDDAWEKVGILDINGFIEEALTQTGSLGALSRYDERGLEYDYRWVETGITQGSTQIAIADDGSFTLTLIDSATGQPMSVGFTSTFDEERGLITNEIADTTRERVVKYWQVDDPDAEDGVRWVTGDELDELTDEQKWWGDAAITVDLFQDGKKVGTFTMDGVAEDKAQQFTLTDSTETGWFQEVEPFILDLTGLPLYSPTGHRYAYVVLESLPEDSEYSATRDQLMMKWDENGGKVLISTTRLYNARPVGESSLIAVTKKWIDGGDTHANESVQVELYAKTDLLWQQDGTDHKAGDVAYEAGALLTPDPVTLSVANAWYEVVGLDVGGVGLSDVEVREVSVTNTKDETPAVYPVMSVDELIAAMVKAGIYADAEAAAADFAPFVGQPIVVTGNLVGGFGHVYTVSTTINYPMHALEVDNTRVGWIELTATKTWVDQGLVDKTARPGVTFMMSSQSSEAVLYGDGDADAGAGYSGYAYVVVSGNDAVKYYVLDANGNKVKAKTLGDGTVVAVQECNVTLDTFTCSFNHMPKYDAAGYPLQYSIDETLTIVATDEASLAGLTQEQRDQRIALAASQREYVGSKMASSPYTVGDNHFKDKQDFAFSNARTGVTSVSFTKMWRDQYIYGVLNQRPDIYLTLYATDTDHVDANGQPVPYVVPGYQGFLWSLRGDDADLNICRTSRGDYIQDVTIGNLSKYDSHGALITYWATESMSIADPTSLYYEPVYYTADEKDDSVPAETIVVAGSGDTAVKAAINGSVFHNDIASSMTVTGQKLWSNLPVGFDVADLPSIKITLSRVQFANENSTSTALKTDDEGNYVTDFIAVTTLEADSYNTNVWNYTFTNRTDDKGESTGEDIAVFDDLGRRYTYVVSEEIIGLNGSHSDFAQEIETVYDSASGVDLSMSFLINNVFKGNPLSDLCLLKTISGDRSQGDLYPTEVTFKLYRQYEIPQMDGSTVLSTSELVDTVVMKRAQFEANEVKSGANAWTSTVEYVFGELPVYAGNGMLYHYYFDEYITDGHEATVEVSSVREGSQSGAYNEESPAIEGVLRSPSFTLTDKVPSSTASTDEANGGVSALSDGKVNSLTTTTTASFKNEYHPNRLVLSGTKVWNDFDDAFGIRPSAITLEVTRTSGTIGVDGKPQTENVVLQDTAPDAANYIVWDTTSQVNTWSYTISNLEYWAPDGTPWTYTVRETSLDASQGYEAVTGSATSSNSAAPGINPGTGTIGQLANRLSGEVVVEKYWQNTNATAFLQPMKITVQLQAKIGDGAWGPAYVQFYNAIGSDRFGSLGVAESDLIAASTQVLECSTTASPSACFTWNNLPLYVKTQSGDTQQVLYRVTEVSIMSNVASNGIITVGTPVVAEGTNGQNYTATATPYTVRGETVVNVDTTKTAITNQLDATSVKWTKVWNDQNDIWDTRPGNYPGWLVRFYLQRSTDGGTTWENVYREKQNPSDDNTQVAGNYGTQDWWAAPDADGYFRIGGLPATDSQNNPYIYRMVEVPKYGEPGQGSLGDAGLGGYENTDPEKPASPDYGTVVTDEDGTCIQTITNTLQTTSLSGSKVWETHGVALDESLRPTLVLYRYTTDPNQVERVQVHTGTNGALEDPVPRWTLPESVDEGETTIVWEWSFDYLPAKDASGQTYTYFVVETQANMPGFHIADGTTKGDETPTLTNVANQIRVQKIDDESADLTKDGIQFTLTGTFVGSSTETTKTLVTDGTGLTDIAVGLIAGNTYTLAEVAGSQPDGYESIYKPLQFVMQTDGSIRIKGNAPFWGIRYPNATSGGQLDTQGVVTLTAQDPLIQIKLTKDLSALFFGASIAGAEFTVTGVFANSDGASVARTFTFSNTSTITIENLKAGETYTLVETVAPEGYKLDSRAFTFAVDNYGRICTAASDGTLVPLGTGAVSGTAYSVESNQTNENNGTVAVRMTDAPLGITFVKSATDNSRQSLSGATFKVEGLFAGSVASPQLATTGSDGTVSITGLKAGETYTVTEVSNPAGYAKSDIVIQFTLTEQGTISTCTATDGYTVGSYSFNDGTVTGTPSITVFDAPIRIDLLKLSADDSTEKLSGAQFELRDQQGNVVIDGIVTGADGVAHIDGRATINGQNNLVTGGIYTLEEVEPAAGFEVMDPVTFRIRDNGQIDIVTVEANGVVTVLDDASDGYTLSRTSDEIGPYSDLTLCDEPIVIKLAKAGYGNALLDKAAYTAEFAVKGVFATGGGAVAAGESSQPVTAADGFTIENLIAGNTYTVEETFVPAGYEKAADFTFTVGKDGAIATINGKAVASKPAYIAVGGTDDEPIIAVTDQPIEMIVKKANADKVGDGLSATFTLSGTFVDLYTGTRASETRTIDVTSGSSTVVRGLIAGQPYTLTETAAPAGFKPTTAQAVLCFDENGALVYGADKTHVIGGQPSDANAYYPYAFDETNGTVGVTLYDEPYKVVVKKVDAEGASLAGAKFTLVWENDKGETSWQQWVDTTGTALFTELQPARADGTAIVYTLYESVAPNGFRTSGERIQFTIDPATGTLLNPVTGAQLAVNNFETDGCGIWNLTNGPVPQFTLADKPIEVDIVKQDLSGTLLTDAQFAVTGIFADGTTGRTLPINGSYTVDSLVAGRTYVLTETVAPAGYECAPTVYFTPQTDGSVVITNESGTPTQADYAFASTGNTAPTITVKDVPVEITLHKTGANGAALAGATFTLEPVGNGAFAVDLIDEANRVYDEADATKVVAQRATTGSNGTLVFTGLVALDTYRLTETAAAPGYQAPDPSAQWIEFTVAQDGTVAGVSSAGGVFAVTVGAVEISAENTPTAVSFKKVAQGDEQVVLDGAVFQITEVDASGTPVAGGFDQSFTTGTDGSFTVTGGLKVGGVYRITETQAPAGYALDAAPFFFTYTDTNTVVAYRVAGVANNAHYACSNSDGLVVTMEDGPIALTLGKVAGDDPAAPQILVGASFTLAPAAGSSFKGGSVQPRILSTADYATFTLDGLLADNTYTLQETAAPAGYELETSTLTFTVTKEGGVSDARVDGAPLTAASPWKVDDANLTFDIALYDRPLEFELVKVSSVASVALDMSNVSFELTAGTDGFFAADGGLIFRDVNLQPVTAVALVYDGTSQSFKLPTGVRLVAGQTYTLAETAAPENFALLQGSYSFAVNADGTLSAVASNDQIALSETGAGVAVATVTEIPLQLQLKKVARANAGTTFEGVAFQVFEKAVLDATPAGSEPEPVAELTTGSNGVTAVVAGAFERGTAYVLREVVSTVPAGYEALPDLVFSFNDDGSVAVADGSDDGWQVDGVSTAGVVLITARDTAITAQIKKQDADGNALPNALFTVTPAADSTFKDGGTAGRMFVTDENGVASLNNQLVIGGIYTVEETTPPAGYKTSGSVQVMVADEGALRIVDASNAAGEGMFVASDQDGLALITVTDNPIMASILKLSAGTDVASRKPLMGAAFQVKEVVTGATWTVEDGKPNEDGNVECDGVIELTGLVAGKTYAITETVAPAGYELAGSFMVTVDNHGKLTKISNPDNEAYTIEGIDKDGIVLVKAYDEPIEVQLVKTDLQGNLLAGATFELSGARFANMTNGTPILPVEPATVVVRELQVGSDGTLVMDGLVAGEVYTLTETKAPDGYELADERFFAVNEDGTVIPVADASGTPFDEDAATWAVSGTDELPVVSVADEPIEVELVKLAEGDAEGKPLEGAVFSVSGRFAAPAEGGEGFLEEDGTQRVASSAEGPARVRGLVAGEAYTVVEVAAPAGYELDPAPAVLVVGADGSVALAEAEGGDGVQDGGGRYAVVEDGSDSAVALVAMSDTWISLTLTKVAAATDLDRAGSPLTGATFSLSGARFAAEDRLGGVELPAAGEDAVTIAGLVTDENGTLTLDRLIPGVDYTLVETAAPTGYIKNFGSLVFSVDEGGAIATFAAYDENGIELSADERAFQFDQEDSKTAITMTDEPLTLLVKKVGADTDGAALPGVTLRLYGGAAVLHTINPDGTPSSSDTGYYLITGLEADTGYALVERVAPAGYRLSNVQVSFKLNERGQVVDITVNGRPIGSEQASEFDYQGYWLPCDDTFSTDDVEVCSGLVLVDQPLRALVAKQDLEGNALEGAEFDLTGVFSDGETDDPETRHVTDAVADDDDAVCDGLLELEHLLAGKVYTLTETKAPDGYELADTVYFTINTYGSVLLCDEQGAVLGGETDRVTVDNAMSTSQPDAIVSVADEPIEVELVKLAEGDAEGKPLEGAVFSVSGRFAAPAEGGEGFLEEDGTQLVASSAEGPARVRGLIAGEAYAVVEVAAPAGYELDPAPAVLVVGADGSVALAGAEGGDGVQDGGGRYAVVEDGSDSAVALVAMSDTWISLTLTKTNFEDVPLAGAEFALAGERFANADGTIILPEEGEDMLAFTVETDQDGLLSIDGLVPGEVYTLTETHAPDGYRLNPTTVFFSVDEYGVIDSWNLAQALDDNTVRGSWSTEEEALGSDAIVLKDQPVTFTLLKTDLGGSVNEGIAGAEFSIAFAEGYEQVSTALEPTLTAVPSEEADGVQGVFTVADLVVGNTYTLTETLAPAGYELAAPITFQVEEDGSLTLLGASAADDAPARVLRGINLVTGVTAYLMVIEDAPIELSVEKVDENGVALEGAQFAFEPVAEGDLFADGTSRKVVACTVGQDDEGALPEEPEEPADDVVEYADDEPAATPEAPAASAARGTIDGFIAGHAYRLTEVLAPDGHQLFTGSATFTVLEDGTIDPASFVVEGTGAAVVLDTTGCVTICVADEPTQLTLVKQDRYTAAPLAGAVFAIDEVDAYGEPVEGGMSFTAQAAADADNGATILVEGVLSVGGLYRIVETLAPEGYELDGRAFYVAYTAENRVEAFEPVDPLTGEPRDVADNYTVSEDGLALTVADQPIDAFLIKTGESGDGLLAGATYELTGIFAGGTEVQTSELTTDASGSVRLTGPDGARLVAGRTYTLVETVAPAGYELNHEQGSTETSAVTITVNDDGTLTLEGAEDWYRVLILMDALAEEDGDQGAPTEEPAESDGGTNAPTADESTVLIANDDVKIHAVLEKATLAGMVEEPVEDEGSSGEGADAQQPALPEVALLAGATFQVTGRFADTPADLAEQTREFTTDADGRVVLENLVGGASYQVVEAVAPVGYLLDATPFTLAVDAYGNVTVSDGTEGAVVADNDEQGIGWVRVLDEPLRLTVHKTDPDGTDVAGVAFELNGIFMADAHQAAAEPETVEILTGTDGTALFEGLIAGQTYTLRETQAPLGLRLSATAVQLVLAADGTVASWEIVDEEALCGETWSLESSATVALADAALTVTLAKADLADTGDLAAARFLPGAQFALTGAFMDENGQVVEATVEGLTTDDQGVLVLGGVVRGGSYQLVETKAPAGYELDSTPFAFFIDEYGTIVAGVPDDQDGPSESQPVTDYLVATDDQTGANYVVAFDQAIRLGVHKTNESGESLEGVSFAIAGVFAQNGVRDDQASECSATTGADGMAYFDGLIAGEEYTLRETVALDGYLLSRAVVHFTVDEHGGVASWYIEDESVLRGEVWSCTDGQFALANVRVPEPDPSISKTGDRGLGDIAAVMGGLGGLMVMLSAAFALHRKRVTM